MKTLTLLFFVILFATCQQKSTLPFSETINPIIGDISYIQKFGEAPTDNCDEQLRIRTHLEYVENCCASNPQTI